SATIGVASLELTGYARWRDSEGIWITWWLGDLSGALILTPLILAWAARPQERRRSGGAIEWAMLVVALLGTAAFVFGGVYAPFSSLPLTFLSIPPLVWAAFRFSPRGTTTAIALTSAGSTWGTL